MGSAKDKRWAMPPPPSQEVGEDPFQAAIERSVESTTRLRNQETQRPGPISRVVSSNEDQEIEPSDSQRVTESPAPPEANEGDTEFETIPAPAWTDDEPG